MLSRLKNNYSVIPNELINDTALTDRARFVYVLLATKPERKDIDDRVLAKEAGGSIEEFRYCINELVDAGWVVKKDQGRELLLVDKTHKEGGVI